MAAPLRAGAPLTSRRAFAEDGTRLTACPTAVAREYVRSVDDERMRGIVGDALPLQTGQGTTDRGLAHKANCPTDYTLAPGYVGSRVI